MTVTALILLVAAPVAIADWWAVATDRRGVEFVAKPATMSLLVVVAAVAGNAQTDVRILLVLGASLGLVGDVALLDDGGTRFLIGLGAFAVGHIAYAAAALRTDFVLEWAGFGLLFTIALLVYRFIPRTLPGARSSGGRVLAGAVVFYAVVITVMVVAAWGTTVALAAIGASLFAVSDWVLGYRRFVGPVPGGRVSVHVPYHVGQAVLLVALATA